jgi:predicted dehydrogenase
MAESVKWGVLGNANIARVCVIPAIQKSRNGIVHGLATRSPEQAAQLVTEHGIERVYASYDALLSDPQIEAVYIPLPNHLHHIWTLRALEAGKHVLCEKPLACNAREAEEMAQAAEDSGLLLMEAFMYRFHPRTIRIKEMVENGVIGAPRLVRSAFCYHIGEGLLTSCDVARLRPEMGGGALLDVGCYGVSLARWLLNAEPNQLQAQAVYHRSGVDVHFVGTLRFANDALATVEASFISALQQTYTVVGSEGAIELPHDAFIPWHKDAVFTQRGTDDEVGQVHSTPGADEYQLMVEHFCDAVSGEAQLDLPPEESVGNMRVLDGLAEAARSGKTVVLNGDCPRVPEANPDTPDLSTAP